jgi:succinate dehydrogenase / fumarate reductase, cytochrome b subunit
MASTSAPHSSSLAPASPRATGHLFARIGSLVSILPLGLWTVNHLWDNLAAFSGARAWEAAVTQHPNPVAHLFTLILVLLPLVLHTGWGFVRLFSFRPNNVRYNNYDNFKYVIQRLTAVGAAGFIGAHLWLAMLQPRLVQGHAETFADIAQHMRFHLPTLVVYVLGTLAVSYHLANGISSFAWTWGLVSGRKSFRRFDRISIVAFIILLGMSWAALYALYRAGGAAA